MPLDTSRDLFHFNEEGALAYAGRHLHAWDSPLHTHSFVEIAFVIGGSGTHHSLAGRQQLEPGDVVLLRPGVWHGYEDCHRLELFNCCFSSELLRRELAWTREDPLLGYLLWTGPYSAEGRGLLTTHLDPAAYGECLAHLTALEALRHRPVAEHRGDIVGRLALLFSGLGRAIVPGPGPGAGPRLAGPPGGRPGDAAAGGPAGAPLDADRAGRRAAPRARLPGPPVQGGGGPAADGLPRPAARRVRRHPAAALRPARHLHRPGGRLARPELLRPPVQGPLRAQCHHLPRPLRP